VQDADRPDERHFAPDVGAPPAARRDVAEQIAGEAATPTPLSPASIAAARAVHERFAALLATAFTRQLRTAVVVEVVHVEPGSRSQLPGPGRGGIAARLSCPQPPGSVDLYLGPRLVHPALDLLLGGTGVNVMTPRRPLTQVERRLLNILLDACAQALGEAWSADRVIRFEVDEPGERLRIAPQVDPEEPVIVVGFEATLLGCTGDLSLGIPSAAFGRLLCEAAPAELLLELRAVLGRATVTPSQLARLAPGDILTTDVPAGASVAVEIDGRLEFSGAPCLFRGQKALRVNMPPDAMKKCSPPRRNKGCD
jgi:flagellar motor switch protein FliM